MKILLLIRHAKAAMPNEGQSDFERVLEKQGEEDAIKIGKKLFAANIPIQKFIVSTAYRTMATSNIIANAMQINNSLIQYESKLYNASTDAYADEVLCLNNAENCVALVGHNFRISEYASKLLQKITFIDMPPCAVIAFAAEVNDWVDFELAEKKCLFYEKP